MLPARIGAALALIGPAALVISACGAPQAASEPEQVSPAGVLSPDWAYTPASAETDAATGMLTVEAGIDALGPSRALTSQKGITALMHLSGEIDPGALVGAQSVGEAMALRGGARPMLQKIDRDGGLCGGAAASYVVWYEPEMIEGRELVLAVVQGAAPGETGSTVCRVLRYTRERDRGTGRNEEAR